jgi:hypothetical protein
MFYGQPFSVRRHLHPDLGGDDHLRALAGTLQPPANNRFRFPALVAWSPNGVNVGGIDEVQSCFDQLVQQLKGRRLIGGPSKHVTAET